MRYFGTVKRSAKAGLPPGSLVYVGRKKEPGPTAICVIEYDGKQLAERKVSDVREILPLKPAPTVTWINVDNVSNPEVLKAFGEALELDPLLMEDILNTEQRPKCELTGRNVYIILKMFSMDPLYWLKTEQVSLVLGENYLISFQEEVGEEFAHLRERIAVPHSRFRDGEASYLAYSMIDTVVDRYFLVLESVGDALDRLEERLPYSTHILPELHRLKRELIFLRKHIWPVREVVSTLQHAEHRLLPQAIQPYLRDVYEHTIQVMDGLETSRDLLSGIQDLYLSITSNRLNEIMRVLTVISTIFIPLTFIVGIYGMNFHYMPELNIWWAYPAVWGVMLLIALGMVVFFRKKKWF